MTFFQPVNSHADKRFRRFIDDIAEHAFIFARDDLYPRPHRDTAAVHFTLAFC